MWPPRTAVALLLAVELSLLCTSEGLEPYQVYGGEDSADSDGASLPLLPEERQALQLHCQGDVQEFIQSNTAMLRAQSDPGSPPRNPDDMLFFLHVPRTAGRTFFSCFLKQAHPPSKRCAKSYDLLRLNVSITDCGLLSSHDDYSVTKYLPETSAIVTQVRNPVDRVLSAYEFSMEVAARELRRPPNATKPSADKVNTRNVWPWSLLVPWMEADMRARIETARNDARRNQLNIRDNWVKYHNKTSGKTYFHNHYKRQSVWQIPEGGVEVPPLDPYNSGVAMPLREFIHHPLVRDTVHNGATLQVLGLTNYSHLPKASKLRHCVDGLPNAKEAMTKAAVGRLHTMYHVGTTDRLEESVTSLASSLKIQLPGPSWKGKADAAFSYEDQTDDKATDGAADELPTNVQDMSDSEKKMRWQARIDEINQMLGDKHQQLRRAKAGIRTSNFKAQTHGASRDNSAVDKELSKFVADAKVLQKQIESLKEEAANLQVMMVRLKTPKPKTHSQAAKLVKDDDAFKNGFNLEQAYHRCVAGSRAKHKKRWMAFQAIRTPDGRGFYFSYEARKKLSPALLQRIRELNSMDMRLYETAQTILQATVDRQTASGSLEKLNPPSDALQAGDAEWPLPPLPPDDSGAENGESGEDLEGATEEGRPAGAGETAEGTARATRSNGRPQQDPRFGKQQPENTAQRPPEHRVGAADQAAGMNRAPRGPQQGNRMRRRSKPNPEAVVDYGANHEEL